MNRQQMRASRAEGRRLMKEGWTPWEDVTEALREIMSKPGRTPLRGFCRAFRNSRYVVQICERPCAWGLVELYMVRRNDEAPVHAWAELQRIKNELAGPGRTAVEFYPPESELVDRANMYHLWVLPEGVSLPFGFRKEERT